MTQNEDPNSEVVEVAAPVAGVSHLGMPLEDHHIAYEVRSQGAIGVFYWRSVTVKSASRLGAEELAAKMIEIKGFERRGGPIHLNEVEPWTGKVPDGLSSMELESLKSGRLSL